MRSGSARPWGSAQPRPPSVPAAGVGARPAAGCMQCEPGGRGALPGRPARPPPSLSLLPSPTDRGPTPGARLPSRAPRSSPAASRALCSRRCGRSVEGMAARPPLGTEFCRAPIPFVGFGFGVCGAGGGGEVGRRRRRRAFGWCRGRAWKTCCQAGCPARHCTPRRPGLGSKPPAGGASGFLSASLSQDSVVGFGSVPLPFYSRGRNSSCVDTEGKDKEMCPKSYDLCFMVLSSFTGFCGSFLPKI